jgi:hypothetical protein
MVLGEFIQSLWESNEVSKEEEIDSINFPQGARYLEFQLNKTERMQNNLDLISNSCGYSPDETLKGQRSLRKASSQSMDANLELIEGFSGIIGNTAANAKNSKDLSKLKRLENTFNKKISAYVTAQKILNDKIQAYMKASSSNNKDYFNKNGKFMKGQIGYITDKGVWKHWKSMKAYESSKGKNGCPTGSTVPINQIYSAQGFAMKNDPNLMLGTDMKSGQSCGNEGKNIYVTSLTGTDGITTKYEGCYDVGDNTGLEYQADIGKKSTVSACATRASDLGLDGFALGDGGEGTSKCYVASNGVEQAKGPGKADDKWTCEQKGDYWHANCNGASGKQDGFNGVYNKEGDCNYTINNINGAVTKQNLKCPTSICDVKNQDGKMVGFSKSDQSAAVYSIPKVSTSSFGKVGYVTDDAQLRAYPDSMTEPNSTFYNLGYYSGSGGTFKTFDDTTLDECKKKCSSDYSDKCVGFSHREKDNKCNLKNDKTYPKHIRKVSSEWQQYLRGKSVTNGSTCPTEVVESTAQQWDAYPAAGQMTKNAVCQMAYMTKEEKKQFEAAHKELQKVAGEIQDVLSDLTKTDEKLVESLGYNVRKLKRDIKQYASVGKSRDNRKEQLLNSSAMADSTELNMVSQNSKYLMWSILAILLVTASIRTRR